MKINTTCLDCTWILFCQNQYNVHLIANFPFPWLENHIHLHIQLQICVFFSLSISLYGYFLLWRICKHPEEKHKKLFKIESSSNSKVDDRSDEHSKWHHFLLWKDKSLEIKNLTKTLPIAVSIVREPAFDSFLWEMVLAFTLSFFAVDRCISSFSKVKFSSCSSSLRFSFIVRSTTWAKGTSWQRINQ